MHHQHTVMFEDTIDKKRLKHSAQEEWWDMVILCDRGEDVSALPALHRPRSGLPAAACSLTAASAVGSTEQGSQIWRLLQAPQFDLCLPNSHFM